MIILNPQTMICPFDEYLKIPGWSHSGIKSDGAEPFDPTEKMRLGTKVHEYLLDPENYGHGDVSIIRPLAIKVKEAIGPAWEYLETEVAVTADFVHEGFLMKYKGRIDMGIRGKIVLDLKVSELNPYSAMGYFHYERPISGYCAAYEAPIGLMLTVNPKTKQTQLFNIPLDVSWWENQIIQRGEIL